MTLGPNYYARTRAWGDGLSQLREAGKAKMCRFIQESTHFTTFVVIYAYFRKVLIITQGQGLGEMVYPN